MLRTAFEVQCDYALSSGLRSEIIWDSLAPDQADILKQKIVTLLPCNETNKKEIQQLRDELFASVWHQRKYTNGVLLSAIIYVLVTDELDNDLAKSSTKFTCHPVFRTRKCLKDGNSEGCCMVFVDEHARVYQNWQQYLKTNKLPAGTMIAPAKGIYTFDVNDEIQLELRPTPSSYKRNKLMQATDMIATIGGIASIIPTPVTPIVGTASLAYTTVRSAWQLRDRRKHERPIGLKNKEARGSWLTFAGGLVGIGSTGATTALKYAAAGGREMSMATKIAVSGINISSVVISGTGIVDSVYSLYMSKSITQMDVQQLAFGLLVFTHSVNNMRIARAITKTGSNSASVLSKVKAETRNTFKTLLRENVKLNGNSVKSDLVRIVNDIPVNDVLHHLLSGNTGQLLTTGGVMLQSLQNSDLAPTIFVKVAGNKYELNLCKIAQNFGNKFSQHIVNTRELTDVLHTMSKYLCSRVCFFIMNLSNTFLNSFVDQFDQRLKTFISTEMVVYKILITCIRQYKNLTFEFLESKSLEILDALENYFDSLNPNNFENMKKVCDCCRGYYYVTT